MKKIYYEEQAMYINEIRSIKHDMQGHMVILQYYLETENYDKAKQYLSDMKGHQHFEESSFVDTGNNLVNAIVSDTLSQSNVKIAFSQNGMLPEKMDLDDYDICTIFSNLFSNAKEACEKLKTVEPMILMEVKCEKNSCFIAVQNPIEWTVNVEELGKTTSKRNKNDHGFGIRNIQKVVEQYDGKMGFVITDQYFRVEILLKR